MNYVVTLNDNRMYEVEFESTAIAMVISFGGSYFKIENELFDF